MSPEPDLDRDTILQELAAAEACVARIEALADEWRRSLPGGVLSDAAAERLACEQSLRAATRGDVGGAFKRMLAEAWDEGFNVGDPWQRRGNPEEAKKANPYRGA